MREVRLRLPSPPLADMTTGLVSLFGGTQVQVPPVKAMPALDSSRARKDKGALHLGIGGERCVDPPPSEHFRAPKNNLGGHREAPPSP